MHYAYLDESGDVAPYSSGRYLIVAVLITASPRAIELHVKRARSRLGRRAKVDELKATSVERVVSERLLKAIADEEVEIVVTIVDKRAILRPPTDLEDLYREAVVRAVRRCVERHPRLELWLDKRYTKPALRHCLEKAIREGMTDLPQQVVLIHQEDSRTQRGLQAVDHVAWAFHEKYERCDDSLCQILGSNVVMEEVVSHHLW